MAQSSRVGLGITALGMLGFVAAAACEPVRGGPNVASSRALELNGRDAGALGGDAGARQTSGLAPGSAPGAPGQSPHWPPARKSFLGTAIGSGSRVYFTGYRGSVSEVFFPAPDSVQTVGLEFLVGDVDGSYVDAESEQPYTSTRPEPRSMRWRVTTENPAHGWRLTKDVFSDPERDALIIVAEVESLAGEPTARRLFLAHDPALGNSGAGDASRVRRTHGRTFLVARDGEWASALGVSSGWARSPAGRPRVSSAFVGAAGSRADLLAGDAALDGWYASASAGNVEQLGQLALDPVGRQRIVLALGFGNTERDAMDTASAVLSDDPDALARRYDAGWRDYAAALDDQGGSADDEYFLAAMTLASMRDKQSGALVAGLGTPWGPVRSDDDNGGYHLVWPRDLFKFGNALITAGDLAAGAGAVRYLFGSLVQTRDCGRSEADAAGCPQGYSRVGRFPQNARIDGTPYWTSTQLDEQAMPILLALRVYERGDAATRADVARLWPRIRSTAEYLLNTGPWSPQERWEETSGYSPSTIAAEIAGLVAAAELAESQGEPASAARYLSAADRWEERVDAWTFTRTGQYGDGHYYIRLNPSAMRGGAGAERYEPEQGPDEAVLVTINNGGGEHDQRAIVDAGFLELVRMGVKAPTDATISGSLPETDATIRQDIPGKGSAWFRYTFDAYGEGDDGAGWTGSNGHGRLWPILTAERGLYELARGADGASFLPMLRAFATPEGFIPEQIWNASGTVAGVELTTPRGREPGTPTDSLAPLSWAMGEYITLLASVHAGRIVDVPQSVCRRYDTCAPQARSDEVVTTLEIDAPVRAGERVYVAGAASLGQRDPVLGAPAHATGAGRWRAIVELPAGEASTYALYLRRADGSWLRDAAGPRQLQVPTSGSLSLTVSPSFGGEPAAAEP